MAQHGTGKRSRRRQDGGRPTAAMKQPKERGTQAEADYASTYVNNGRAHRLREPQQNESPLGVGGWEAT